MALAEGSTRYGELCRLCATKTSLVGLNIFETEGNVRQINKKIQTCLPVQVHESDDLPKMICGNCLYKLEQFFEFRERTLRTELLLIDLFKEISSSAHVASLQNVITSTESLKNDPSLDMVTITLSHHHHSEHYHSDLDLSAARNIIVESVEEGGILHHDNLDMGAHSLDSIELGTHDLSSTSRGLHSHNDAGEALDALTAGAEQYQISVEDTERLLAIKDEKDNDMVDQVQKVASAANKVTKCNTLLEVGILTAPCLKEMGTSHVGLMDCWYYCNICGKTLAEKEKFQQHYEEHFSKCNDCLAVFTNKEALNAHRKETHYGTPRHQLEGEEEQEEHHFPDAIRPQNVANMEEAEEKLLLLVSTGVAEDTHHDFPRETAKTLEIEEDDPDDPLAVAEDEEDSSFHRLEFEKREEDEDEKSAMEETAGRKKVAGGGKVCKECGKSYKTNYKLSEHMRKHTGEQPYKCSSCDKAFRSKIGLAQHEAKHTGQYEFSCPTCGKGFQCKSYLVVHQRVHSDLKPYPCTTCGRNFKTKQSLLDHMNRHLGVKPYMCEVCGRGFITKGLCKSHQKIHTGIDNRKFSCKVCQKMFVSKSYLQTHLRIHTGEKPFMCEVCGKGFLTRVDLRIHSTMHTGEKSYVCEMCGKAFARRDALRCHRRSHTGERPYSCDQCGQTFTQFSPMAIHKRLHTGERPYTCQVCSKTFVSRSTMMAHSKKHLR